MAISRAQLAKELEPGLNALFGMEYDRYDAEHAEIYDTESSDRAFEEEVMLSGFGNAPTKAEGAGVNFDTANEVYTARYTHETIALAFALTQEAMEDNLYDRLGARYTRALARSMAHSKQVKAAATLNNAFDSSFTGGDGKELCATDHPLGGGGTFRNEPSTAADLNETSLENALIDISTFVDERNMIKVVPRLNQRMHWASGPLLPVSGKSSWRLKIIESKDNSVDLTTPKLIFIALNLASLGVALYKMKAMGLLPVTAADWTGYLVQKSWEEYGAIPLV